MVEPMSEGDAPAMRRLWFGFLDAVEPARPKLYGYCRRLTGSILDAEDLAQETLLRAFAAIGLGELVGGRGPVLRLPAYLSRIATNLWIDALRRGERAAATTGVLTETSVAPAEPITRAAGSALFARTAPQERAAVVLKDVFDFTLEEIADILSTSEGAVKAALHRGREKLAAQRSAPLGVRGQPASVELIDRFVAAFNARDIEAVTATLLERVAYEARGVGGERGRSAIWVEVNVGRPPTVRFERRELEGDAVMIEVFTSASGRKLLTGVSRLEEAEGRISRHVGYYFCPETLELAARALGLEPANNGYHQDPQTLERMIADSRLPWAGL